MQIALFRGTSIISRLIKWQTNGCYSHAALLFSDGSVIESKEGVGVRYVEDGITGTKGVKVDIFNVLTSGLQDTMIRSFAHSQIGKSYDYAAILRFLSRDYKDFHAHNRWFCSELVFAAFRYASIELLTNISPYKVHPSMLSYSPLLKLTNTIRI